MTPLTPTVAPPSPRRLFVDRDVRASQSAWSNAHAVLDRGPATPVSGGGANTVHTPARGKACASEIWRERPHWAIVGSKGGYGN